MNSIALLVGADQFGLGDDVRLYHLEQLGLGWIVHINQASIQGV